MIARALGLLVVVLSYQPPTAAPVSDPFRPPPRPWMAGNRGIEYATEAGSAVVAIGAGTVAFAGPVAGRNVVTVLHPDGLRSSYTHLARIEVRVGDRVGRGSPLARAGTRLHLGVRRGRRYLDPASLWGRTAPPGRPVLVPVSGRRARAPVVGPLGGRSAAHYTGSSARHPVGHRPTRPPSPNGR